MKNEKKPCTWYVVQQAMKIVSKDVRCPKCIRDNVVKSINNKNVKGNR